MGSVHSARAPKSKLCVHCGVAVEKHSEGVPIILPNSSPNEKARRLLHNWCRSEFFAKQRKRQRDAGGQRPCDVPTNPDDLPVNRSSADKAISTRRVSSKSGVEAIFTAKAEFSRGQRLNIRCPFPDCSVGKTIRLSISNGIEIRHCREGHDFLVEPEGGDGEEIAVLIPREWSDRLVKVVRARSSVVNCVACRSPRDSLKSLFSHLKEDCLSKETSADPEPVVQLVEPVEQASTPVVQPVEQPVEQPISKKRRKISEMLLDLALEFEKYEDRLEFLEKEK